MSASAASRDRTGPQHRLFGLPPLLVIVALPVLATIVLRSGRSYFPVQDSALTDLRVRDVWSRNIPLTGPYSRYGWNHAGPSMFYFLAPLSLLAGKAAWATQVGAALLQGIPLVWGTIVAYRFRGLGTAAAWATVVALTYRALGPWMLLQPWNPNISLPWFALFLVQVWVLSSGDLRVLPSTAFTGSFLVQTHVGYAPLVAVPLVFAAVAGRRRPDAVPRSWRSAPWPLTAAVLAVLWAPPLIQSVAHPPGNLVRIIQFFAGHGSSAEHPLGLPLACRLAGRLFAWPPIVAGRGDSPVALGLAQQASALWLLWPCLLLAAAWLAARRRADRDGQRLIALAACVLVTAAISISRVTGGAQPYLFYWALPVAGFVVVTGLAVLARNLTSAASVQEHEAPVRKHRDAWTAAGLAAAYGVSAVVAGGLVLGVAHNRDPMKPQEVVAQHLTTQLTTNQVVPRQPFLIRGVGSSLLGVKNGIADELLRKGYPLRVDQVSVSRFGSRRFAAARSVSEMLYVIEDSWLSSVLPELGRGGRLLAAHSPLPAAQDAEYNRLTLELYGQLKQDHRLDLSGALGSPLLPYLVRGVNDLDRQAAITLGTLNGDIVDSGTCRCAVYAFPAATAPSAAPRA